MGTAFLLYNVIGWVATLGACYFMSKNGRKTKTTCDDCLFLKVKRKRSFNEYRYECKPPYEAFPRKFDVCPEICGDYVPININGVTDSDCFERKSI